MRKLILIIIIIILLFFFWYLLSQEELILVSSRHYYQTGDREKDIFELEMLTYNIQHGVGIDGVLDLNRTISAIKESGAEIIGLNEVDVMTRRSGFRNQASYLAEALEMNYAYGASIKKYSGSYGNAILSRYPIIDVENIILPVLEESSGENRSLLKAEIELSKGKTVYILLTHLSVNMEERGEQIRWIGEYLKDLSRPYILMGDFNTEVQEVLSYIRGNNDRLLPLIDGIKTYPVFNPSKGIDLYFSGDSVEVLEEYSIESFASDHLPIYLKIRLSLTID